MPGMEADCMGSTDMGIVNDFQAYKMNLEKKEYGKVEALTREYDIRMRREITSLKNGDENKKAFPEEEQLLKNLDDAYKNVF